jgi:hypothetical protein
MSWTAKPYLPRTLASTEMGGAVALCAMPTSQNRDMGHPDLEADLRPVELVDGVATDDAEFAHRVLDAAD